MKEIRVLYEFSKINRCQEVIPDSTTNIKMRIQNQMIVLSKKES